MMAGSMRPSRPGTAGECGGDTTMTKIFVGGLAWETRRDSMRRYFEQFGEILEAVVITDKHTGRSKGYGFVTFKDPESARRACLEPSPVIDGRRANCNLASEGHHRPPPPPPPPVPPVNPLPFQVYRPVRPIIQLAPPGYHRPSTYLNQSTNYTFPYWCSNVYSQESVYPYGYYNVGGGGLQQYQYYTGPGTSSSTPTMIQGYYNLYNYNLYAQPNLGGGGDGHGPHYGQVVPYHYLTQQYTAGLVPLSGSLIPAPATAASPTGGPGGSLQPPSGPDQTNSA